MDELQVAAYDKTQGKMAFFDPSRTKDFLFISGTKVILLLTVLIGSLLLILYGSSSLAKGILILTGILFIPLF